MLTRTPKNQGQQAQTQQPDQGAGARVEPPRCELQPDGRYRIDGYDAGPGFCSFLPGIAGPDGVPLWCMYVNRAQAIASFGVGDKDHAIVEYLPATWAYQLVGVQGFRTFCKIDGAFYEPFRDGAALEPDCTRSMHVQMDTLELTETNPQRGLRFNVQYFSPVNRVLGALARRVTITNISGQRRALTVLDGLPLIIPAGLSDWGLKGLRHIHEAYASVRLVRQDVPYYAAKVAAHDEAEVVAVTAGTFYAAWVASRGQWRAVQPLVDPHIVFGGGHDLITPRHFINRPVLEREAQVWENRMPCALVPMHVVLEPEESVDLYALAGQAPHEHLLHEFLAGFAKAADFERALSDSHALVGELLAPATQVSSNPTLDAYVRHNFLDNILRGGVPIECPSTAGPTLLHLYSRRHGDLERDYNYFIVPPHPLSSGAGNYRDVCQNRRSDAWFYPQVGAQEIRLFVELLQADGYNPLGIDGYRWRLAAEQVSAQCPTTDGAARKAFERLVTKGYQPGELVQWARVHAVQLPPNWLAGVLAQSERMLVAKGHEGGYWIDHWTYITDLLEAFAAVYPDEIAATLTGAADVTWFDEGAYVVPRSQKYQQRTSGLLQVDAVVDGKPAAALPPTTMLGKLAALIAIKAVSFDFDCRGIEMEAGRPGWNDAMNGLPGLFGSSTCEAAELARMARWLRAHLPSLPDTELPVDVADFVERVVLDVEADYDWGRAVNLRELFRAHLRERTGMETRRVSGATLARLLDGAARRAVTALERAQDAQSGLVHTYYRNRPHEQTNGAAASAATPLKVKSFTPEPLPLFLEGQVHWLRLAEGQARARDVYRAVRNGPLFDAQIQMYKLNECLEACGPDIGRARTFARGWFENESVWLHMSYKYLLELLRAGLYEEFFTDARTMLVPFMDPEVYGRSVLENSSFLGSSANPDPATHGRGFIARLSGSTAEFIQIWLLLTVGAQPFETIARADGTPELRLRLRPTLPAAWFTTEATRVRFGGREQDVPAGSFACALLGDVLLVYRNSKGQDTFGPQAVKPVRYVVDGEEFVGEVLADAAARRVRARACQRMEVWLE